MNTWTHVVLTRTVSSSSIAVNILKSKTNHSSTQRTVIGIHWHSYIYIYIHRISWILGISILKLMFNPIQRVPLDLKLQQSIAPTTPTSCNRMKSWESLRNHNNMGISNKCFKEESSQSIVCNRCLIWIFSFGCCDIVLFLRCWSRSYSTWDCLIMFHEDQIFQMNLHFRTKERTKWTSNNNNNHLYIL